MSGSRPAVARRRGPLLGAVLELEVGGVAHGGHCVARHEGRVVFVRHTLPGERVRVVVTEDSGGSYCRADAVEVLRESPDRVSPPCPWSGPGRCGGCDFQHVSPAAQRSLKAAVVVEQLTRLGGLSTLDDVVVGLVVEELPGGALDWRTRMQFAVDRRGRAGLRAHRSHRVVAVDDCPIAHPAVSTPQIVGRRWPGATGVDVTVSAAGDRVVLRHGRRSTHGTAALTEHAAGRDWRVTVDAFWQVHPAAADALASCVVDLLAVVPGERVLDLYGGVGLFAGVLAEAVGPGGSVCCVESDPVAAADATVNLPAWASALTRHVDAALVSGLGPFDVVVLDPPRAGAGREVCTALVDLGPRAVAYVACDPAALARDVRTFIELGWKLRELRALDLFPMTAHVECVALFVRPVP